MKPELINQLHSELENVDRQLVEISEEWQQVEKKWHDTISDWEQRVIAIGLALIESKTEYGKGWKGIFPSLGFEFSYSVARRYVACAEHPEARGEANSVEDWAKAAADRKREANAAESEKEAKRKERVVARKLKEAQLSDNLTAYDEQDPEAANTSGPVPANHSHLKRVVNDCCLQDQMQKSFDQLHDAIVTDPRLTNLRPHWQRLLDGLQQGLVPRIRAVSPCESDDTVDAGGIDIAFDRETELLNA